MDILPLDGGVFPQQVIKNILLMLPVKTLFRFKLVAKSWDAFISCRDFVKNHLDLANRSERLLTVCFNPSDRKRKIEFMKLFKDGVTADDEQIHMPFETPGQLRLEDSCNGLVCLKTSFARNIIYLWNPATQKYRCLPPLPHVATFVEIGMCYIQETDDYKIVTIPSLTHGSVGTVSAYSLNSDSWRTFNVDFRHGTLDSARPTAVNECIHWITNEVKESKILVWDAKVEFLRYMQLPVILRMSKLSGRHLAIIKGSLSVVVAFFLDDVFELVYKVWKMGQYDVDSSWSPIFSIRLQENALPLGSWQDGRLLFSYQKRNYLRFFSYDPSTAKIQHFHYNPDHSSRFLNYIESLESIEGGEARRNSFRRVAVQPTAINPILDDATHEGNSENSFSGMVAVNPTVDGTTHGGNSGNLSSSVVAVCPAVDGTAQGGNSIDSFSSVMAVSPIADGNAQEGNFGKLSSDMVAVNPVVGTAQEGNFGDSFSSVMVVSPLLDGNAQVGNSGNLSSGLVAANPIVDDAAQGGNFGNSFSSLVAVSLTVEGTAQGDNSGYLYSSVTAVSPVVDGTSQGGTFGNSFSGMVVSDGSITDNDDNNLKVKRAEKLKRELKRLETSNGFMAESSGKGKRRRNKVGYP